MRIRITFTKDGPMKYIGHLDHHKVWERSFRRSGLPLAYSLGFHPQPRLNLACALPVGFTSQCEILDAWLEADRPLETIVSSLSPALPAGLLIQGIESVADQAPALQTQVSSTVYSIHILDTIPDLESRIERIVSAGQLPRVRRGKPYDLRPLIENISPIFLDEQGNYCFQVQLSAREAATGRPEELLDEIGLQFENARVHREKLIFNVLGD